MSEITKDEAQQLILNTFNEFSRLLRHNKNNRPMPFHAVSLLSNVEDLERILAMDRFRNELFDGLSTESYDFLLRECSVLADIYSLSTKNKLRGKRIGDRLDAITGAAPRISERNNINYLNTLSPNALLKMLGEYGNPEARTVPTLRNANLAEARYIHETFTEVSLSNTLNAMLRNAADAPGGGGVIPGPLPMMGTGEAFLGTIQVTIFRRRGSERIDGWILKTMQQTDKINPAGWPQYSLQLVDNKNIAERILLHHPDFLLRIISGVQPSGLKLFKENLINILGF